ncbi:MAG: hypothetical protein E7164_02110 [Firmicutes bacterium]|nr:hypothetical protein [Bacillota bacterium]
MEDTKEMRFIWNNTFTPSSAYDFKIVLEEDNLIVGNILSCNEGPKCVPNNKVATFEMRYFKDNQTTTGDTIDSFVLNKIDNGDLKAYKVME